LSAASATYTDDGDGRAGKANKTSDIGDNTQEPEERRSRGSLLSRATALERATGALIRSGSATRKGSRKKGESEDEGGTGTSEHFELFVE